jgi:hypothetical protein
MTIKVEVYVLLANPVWEQSTIINLARWPNTTEVLASIIILSLLVSISAIRISSSAPHASDVPGSGSGSELSDPKESGCGFQVRIRIRIRNLKKIKNSCFARY